MDDNEDETITLEEILVEMIDSQLALIDAVTGGEVLTDPDALKERLQDLRDLLEQADVVSEED
jgi:hypothetical protein